jgi:hypothetical protein
MADFISTEISWGSGRWLQRGKMSLLIIKLVSPV